jgi:hypothetical protein
MHMTLMALEVVILRTVPMLWFGLVAGISFLEAPLKFRAPGVTTELGLGIGRVVFRALNMVELGLAALLGTALAIGWVGAKPLTGIASRSAGVLAIGLFLVQLLFLRPVLNLRLDQRLAGVVLPPTHHHLAYIGLEAAKLLCLLILGVAAALAVRPRS